MARCNLPLSVVLGVGSVGGGQGRLKGTVFPPGLGSYSGLPVPSPFQPARLVINLAQTSNFTSEPNCAICFISET